MVQVLLKVIDGMTIDIALQVRVEEVFFFFCSFDLEKTQKHQQTLSLTLSLSLPLSLLSF